MYCLDAYYSLPLFLSIMFLLCSVLDYWNLILSFQCLVSHSLNYANVKKKESIRSQQSSPSHYSNRQLFQKQSNIPSSPDRIELINNPFDNQNYSPRIVFSNQQETN